MIEIFSVICNDNQDLIMDFVEILEKDIDRIRNSMIWNL